VTALAAGNARFTFI